MANEAIKAEALAAIAREREAWTALVAEVGEGRMLEPGPMGQWTFKDLAAHLTGWRVRSLDRLESAARGEPEPPPRWPAELTDDDSYGTFKINAWLQAQGRNQSVTDVLADAATSYDRLGAVVQRLSPGDLVDGARFPWLEGDALGPALVDGSFFAHLHEEHEPAVREWLAGTE